jgi:hypothetical protein
LTIAGNIGANPFEIFAQDTDEVIMLINYYLRIGAEAKGEPAPITDEKENDTNFWDML